MTFRHSEMRRVLGPALRQASEGQFAAAIATMERAIQSAVDRDGRQEIAGLLGEVARLAEQAGDGEHAVRALEAATAAVEWADLWCRLGRLQAQRGRRREARRALEHALAINPRYRAAAVERALLDAGEGRIGEAMETLRMLATEAAPAEPVAFQQGLEQLSHAEFESAAPLLRQALDAGDPWLDEQLRAYQEVVDLGDLERARQILRGALEERPAYPDLHLLLGAHELHLGATDDAIESLAHALELHPDYHAARIEFARALEARGDTPQALRQLEHVLECESGHSEAREMRDRLIARRRGVRARASPASNRS